MTTKDISETENQIKQIKPQVLFGVGGGTIIDSAKTSSEPKHPLHQHPNNRLTRRHRKPPSLIKGTGKPYSILSQAPMAIIADTNIIAQGPWRFVVSGCGDVIAKLTAVKDYKLAHKETNEYYGEYAASLALMSSTLVIKNAKQITQHKDEGIRVLLKHSSAAESP